MDRNKKRVVLSLSFLGFWFDIMCCKTKLLFCRWSFLSTSHLFLKRLQNLRTFILCIIDTILLLFVIKDCSFYTQHNMVYQKISSSYTSISHVYLGIYRACRGDISEIININRRISYTKHTMGPVIAPQPIN